MKITPISLLALALLFVGCIKTDKERALSEGAVALTKQEALAQFAGNTLVGSIPQYDMNFVVYYATDGRISGTIEGPVNDNARGTWRINDDGQVCNDWSKRSWKSTPPCNTYYRVDDEYKVFLDEGGIASLSKIEKGNSKNLEMRTDLEVAKLGGALERLEADALRKMLPGNTVHGQLTGLGNAEYYAFYGDMGKVAARIPTVEEEDRGSYRITKDDEVCVTWRTWLDQKESCGHWYRDDETLQVFDEAGNLALTARVRKGNSEKLQL